jgi:putative NADH-flavin reductase
VTAVVRDSPRAAAAIREWEEVRPAAFRVHPARDAGHPVTAEVVGGAGAGAGPAGGWADATQAPTGRLRVVVVRDLSAAELAKPFTGRDAVLSALGPSGRTTDPTVNSRAMRATIEAMRTAGTRRILAVSAAPVSPADGPLPYRAVVRPLLWRLFGNHYADLARMEQLLRESGLDWTVVQPPRLTDRPATGRRRTVLEGTARGFRVCRADVAGALLDLLADPASSGHAYGVA